MPFLIRQNSIVDGIAQIDFVQSTKGEIGRTTIGLSLVQLHMRKPKQFENSTSSSGPSDVPQVFKMRRDVKTETVGEMNDAKRRHDTDANPASETIDAKRVKTAASE